MLIPITIGYDGDKKIVDDLVELNHILVYIKDKQMDYFNDVNKYNLLDNNDYTHLYTLDYRNNITTSVVHNFKRLNSIYKNLDERYEILRNSKCRNISEYNKARDEQMKHIVVLVFGYPCVTYPKQRKIINIFDHILMLGRAVGIHLINITNDISNISDATILNYPCKICTRNYVDKDMFCLSEGFVLDENELSYDFIKNDNVMILNYKKEDYMKED